MNKRKPDDEFASIDLSYFSSDGSEHTVYCLESKHSNATQNPRKEEELSQETSEKERVEVEKDSEPKGEQVLKENHVKIHYGDIGYGYESVFGPYLEGAKSIQIEDPFIRQKHQVVNFLKFCELAVKIGDVKEIHLKTNADDAQQRYENEELFAQIEASLHEKDVKLTVKFSDNLHDRQILLSNGWRIILGRGLDYFQSLAGNYFQLGTNEQELRPCLETNIDFLRIKE